MFKILKNKNNNKENNTEIEKKIDRYRSNKQDRLILSKNYSVPIDSKNTNVCVVGAAGSGKTYNFLVPNLMQANSSYIVPDRFLNTYNKTAPYLKSEGYEVKLIDLSFADVSNNKNYQLHKYNPFSYIRTINDIETLANVIIRNTGDKKAIPEFQELIDNSLLILLISFIEFHLPKEKQNFQTVLELLKEGKLSGYIKSIEELTLKETNIIDPDKDLENYVYYKNKSFKAAAGKDTKYVYSSCLDRLKIFESPALIQLMSEDNLELDTISDRKTAIFINLFERNEDLNLVTAMLYSQAMELLCNYTETTSEFSQLLTSRDEEVIKVFRAKDKEDAELKNKEAEEFLEKCKNAVIVQNHAFDRFEALTNDGELILFRRKKEDAVNALCDIKNYGKVVSNKDKNGGFKSPIPVRIFTKEFYRIGIVPNLLFNMHRFISRNLSIVLSLHDFDQLKEMYENNWEEIINCCGMVLFMGGKTPEIERVLSKISKKEEERTGLILSKFDEYNNSFQALDFNCCYCIIRSKMLFAEPKYNPIQHNKYNLVQTLALTEDF